MGTAIFYSVLGYFSLGIPVAVAFLAFGLDRIDPAAHHAYVFRPLLVPGCLLLWPVVLWRWAALERVRRGGVA